MVKLDSFTTDNLQVFNDRLAELIKEKEQNHISAAEFQALKLELEKNLLMDIPDTKPSHAGALSIGGGHWLIAVAIGTGVFTTSLATYLLLGRSTELPAYWALQPDSKQANTQNSSTSVIAALEQKIVANPENLDNRFLLAKSFIFTQQYQNAAGVYADIVKLLPPSDSRYPRVLSAYAEALYMANNETLNTDIDALAQKALQLDPKDFTALTLQGIGAYQQGDYQQAISAWQSAVATAPQEQIDNFLQPALASAREKFTAGNRSPNLPAFAEGITVRVELAAGYRQQVTPDAVVFVIARPLGEKMPVAIQRILVKELPAQLQLDDSSALMPSRKLSTLTDAEVLARISKSGQAAALPGDLTTAAIPVKAGTKNTIHLQINQVMQ